MEDSTNLMDMYLELSVEMNADEWQYVKSWKIQKLLTARELLSAANEEAAIEWDAAY